jgi:hypothetical protein
MTMAETFETLLRVILAPKAKTEPPPVGDRTFTPIYCDPIFFPIFTAAIGKGIIK